MYILVTPGSERVNDVVSSSGRYTITQLHCSTFVVSSRTP